MLEELNEVLAEPTQESQPEDIQQDIVEEAPAPPKESSKEQNLRILRERAEKAEREADEMRRFVAQQQMQVQQQIQQQQRRQEPQEEEFNLNPNDLPEWGQVTKYIDKRTKQQGEELRQTKQQLYEMTVEAKLKQLYPDFDAVVNSNNIELLKQKSSAIASAVDSAPDLFTKASAAYDAIKSLGIAQETQQAAQHDLDKERVARNLAKPRPAAAISAKPLDNAALFGAGPLTPERKKAIYAEVQKIKMRATAPQE